MSTAFKYHSYAFELLDGEYRRYRNNPREADHEEYLCIAKSFTGILLGLWKRVRIDK